MSFKAIEYQKNLIGIKNLFPTEVACFETYKQEFNTAVALEKVKPYTGALEIKYWEKCMVDWRIVLDYYVQQITNRGRVRGMTDEEIKEDFQTLLNATRGRG